MTHPVGEGDASIAPVLPSDPPVDPWHVPGLPGGHKGPGEGGSFCIMMGVMEGGLYDMYGKKQKKKYIYITILK